MPMFNKKAKKSPAAAPEKNRTPETPDDWFDVLTQLRKKKADVELHLVELRKKRGSLLLEVAMGGEMARRRSVTIAQEITDASQEVDDLDNSITAAQLKLDEAREHVGKLADRQRRERIRNNLQKYVVSVERSDMLMAALTAEFAVGRESLLAARADMGNASDANQLFGNWGPTLAAAHYGLGKYLELGPRAAHITHRKPLADYVRAFTRRWLVIDDDSGPKAA